MTNVEYETRVDNLLRSWKDDVYGGVLEEDVLPAIRIYAHASLDGVTDEYDVPALFPMFSDRMDLHDHYGNALFSRLSSACTSIRNALQSIHSHMDCHAAIAASRRAHESMWQMFWLGNPEVDGNARIKRLVAVTQQEIQEALRFWSIGINSAIASKLQEFHSNFRQISDKPEYLPKFGRAEYHGYFDAKTTSLQLLGARPVQVEGNEGALMWSMMSNMAHPNVVFDWIIQMQDDPQDRMDRLQLIPAINAIGMVSNLSTLMMREARMTNDQVARVNTTVARCLPIAESLLELPRR